MAVTSGTYKFANPQSVDIISDAYERIGMLVQDVTQQHINSAQRSLNFILQSWINKGLNLWTVKQGMLALTVNQASYNLPLYTSDVLEATIRTSTRNLGGTPFSSAGGVAANAFDNNPQTACTQNAPNGYISYNWGVAQYSISMAGIQSNVTATYTLVFEYSNDNVNWFNAATIPAQTFTQGQLLWFVIPVPTPASVFRVRETGGSTLNVQEIYFNSLLNDTIITRASRAEYISYPNKNQSGRPSIFYVDRQINPVIYIWPTPTALFNNLFYTYTLQMQDIGSMVNAGQIPARFLEALTADLTHRVAIKYGKKLGMTIADFQYLKGLADEEYMIAGKEDRERVPLRIYGEYLQGWTQT